jgi:hypothetical protein
MSLDRSASIFNAVAVGLLTPAIVFGTAWACGFTTSPRIMTFGFTCMLGGSFLAELDRHLRRQPECDRRGG